MKNGKNSCEKSLVSCCKQTPGTTLKHPKVLHVELDIELCSCPEYSSHMATFTIADCTATVSQGDKEIGIVSAGLGSLVFLRDNATDYDYVVDPRKLWRAFQKALAEQKV